MGSIYFDNAATSFPKPDCVILAAEECIRDYCANPGRSTHKMAVRAAEAVYDARESLAEYLGSDNPERITFTSNATHSLNIAIKGLINHKCHVITSDFEHNSVVRPLYTQSLRFGVEISQFNSDLPLEESIPMLLRNDTEFIVTSIASNVTGKVLDVDALSRISYSLGLTCIIDASQYLGHHGIDLRSSPLDVICAPGHKALFGLQGTGFLYLREGIMIDPIIGGGSGGNSTKPYMPDTLPDRLEAGTLNTPGIISLGAGVGYLKSLGNGYIEEKLDTLTKKLHEILLEARVELFGVGNGIAAFGVKDYSPAFVSRILDDEGIATRSGLHCSPSAHKKMGSFESGCVRISLSIFNTENELYTLYKALRKMSR